MNNLKCIAVDDEPFALELLCTFINQTPFLDLNGRYTSALDALQVINKEEIDLIFLDIQMPGLTGIELARVLDRRNNLKGPRLIFTTAFDQFALEGYKVDALDYLLKPFNYEEFLRAATKAQAYSKLVKQPDTATNKSTIEKVEQDYLFLKVEYQLVRVHYDNILYIQGLKDYVKVYLKDKSKPILSLTSLKNLEQKLPSHRFMRIHRSYIVSLDKISAITRNKVQIEAVKISVSEQYKEDFNQFLSRWVQ